MENKITVGVKFCGKLSPRRHALKVFCLPQNVQVAYNALLLTFIFWVFLRIDACFLVQLGLLWHICYF